MKKVIELNDIQLRKALGTDSEALTALALRSKAHWGYSSDFIESVKAELTVQSDYIMRSPVLVAEWAQMIVGFSGLSTIKDSSHPELTFMFVEPNFLGSGIGKLLWEATVAEAKLAGLQSFKILSDPRAEAFYLKMGAKRIGETRSSIRLLPLLEFHLD